MAPQKGETKVKKTVKATANPAIEKPKKERRVTAKKEKDPNQPKRPQSAYFLWMNSVRAQLKVDNPDLSHKQVISKAGSDWKLMSENDKIEYNEQAAVLKKQYEEAMKKYKGGGGSNGVQKKAAQKTKQPAVPVPMEQSEEEESEAESDDE